LVDGVVNGSLEKAMRKKGKPTKGRAVVHRYNNYYFGTRPQISLTTRVFLWRMDKSSQIRGYHLSLTIYMLLG